MKKKTEKSGNTREQLSLPGMEAWLCSADSVDSRQGRKSSSYDPAHLILSRNT